MKYKIVEMIKRYFAMLFVLILVGFAVVNTASSILNKVAERSIGEIAALGANIVARELDKYTELLIKLSNLDSINNPNISIEEKINILYKLEEEANVSNIGIADSNGLFITNRYKDGIGVSDRTYFQKAISGETYIDGPIVSRADGDYIVVIAVPIFYENKVTSVLIAVYQTEELSRIVENIKYMETGYTFMTDDTGLMIANHDRSQLGSKMSDIYHDTGIAGDGKIQAIEEKMIAGLSGFSEFAFQGKDYFIGYQKVERTTWSLAVVAQKSEFLGVMTQLFYMIVFMVIIAGISMMLGGLYSQILKKRLKKHELTSQSAIDTANIMTIKTDSKMNIIELNHYAIEKIGYPNDQIVGLNLFQMMDTENQNKITEMITEYKNGKELKNFDITLQGSDHKDIHTLFYINRSLQKDTTDIEFMGIDISDKIRAQRELKEKHEELTSIYEELEASEEEIRQQCIELENSSKSLEYLAYHDVLTGLPNRQKLNIVIDEMVQEAIKNNTKFCALFIDTDNFKFVNDKLGHVTGDHILIEIAQRLSNEIMSENTKIFRIGGDEFIILSDNISETSQCEELAKQILRVIEAPFVVNEERLFITVSVGISVFPDDSNTLDEMLKNADVAMYKAKDDGKNRYVFFHKSLHDALVDKIFIEENLQRALSNHEFILFYQPLVDLNTEKINGFEALIRWNHPTEGIIPPYKFISVAERTGQIIPIGLWVLEQACMFLKELQESGIQELYMSVNISVIQLIQPDFVEHVKDTLVKTGVNSASLMLEITESVLIESFEENLVKLKQLDQMGIRLALDDFGEGYSSFAYLRKLPIKALKIDKSFIDNISYEKNDWITGAIVTVGHQLGLDVIAEGVETSSQIEYLKKIECDKVQGYFYSKPIPREAIKLLLENGGWLK